MMDVGRAEALIAVCIILVVIGIAWAVWVYKNRVNKGFSADPEDSD